MTTQKEQILACIRQNPNISGAEVGARLAHIPQSSIHCRISELVRDGLVGSTADPTNINKRVYYPVVRRTSRTSTAPKMAPKAPESTTAPKMAPKAAPAPAPAPAASSLDEEFKKLTSAFESFIGAVKTHFTR